MALSIQNDEVERRARELAELTGESLTEAVVLSLRERQERKRAAGDNRPLVERLMEIGRECARPPRVDDRAADDIVGHDPHGLPT
ncbi:type II toxin-antitoxin system VapB family antitoxin [Myxococcota bacterium]|nr:type II toxin-antitoxin system VapB family antitoxin [Myxococcota bacterium]